MFKILFLILFVMSSAAFAQEVGEPVGSSETGSQNSKAYKIDEFGPLAECDHGARIDYFLVELQKQPDAKGYIIYYKGANALPSEIEKPLLGESLYLNYIKMRKFDSSRIVLINSYREETATELWIVPENAEPPQPTDAISKPKISLDQTLLYDRGWIDSYNDFDNYLDLLLPVKKAQYDEFTKADEETSEETSSVSNDEEQKLSPEELESLKFSWTSDRFGTFLEKNKKMKGVIMFYADDQEFDINKVTNHIEEGKQRIAEKAKIAPERIKIMFGGYKSYIQIEFWAVPENGNLPEAQPEEKIIEVETEVENQ